MMVYYNLEGDICINFEDMFAEPDVLIRQEGDIVKIIAGDTETEIECGPYIDVREDGDKLVIDFDATTEEVDGIEFDNSLEVEEVIVMQGGEPVAEITPEGVKDKQEIEDEKAAEEGKKCRANGQYFDTLKEAVASAQAGEALEIVMIADETGAGIGLFNADGDVNKDITIDFNKHKYIASSPAVGSAKTETQALHFEMNNKVTLKNGEFTSDRGAADIKMLIQNYCDLTLDGMICDCADDASITYVVSNNFGNCLVKDSELHAHPSRVAMDCWFGLGKTYDSGLTVTAQNSILDSTIEYGAQRAAINRAGNEDWYERTILTLDGCTFGQIVNSGAGANDKHTIIINGNKYEGELPIVPEE